MTKETEIEMNAVRLREMFMNKAAEKLLQQYVDVVQAKDTFHSTNVKAREEMWSLLKHAIMSTRDSEKQEFQNTNDIIKAVQKGTMTVQEGKDFLELLRMQKGVDNTHGQQDQIDHLGFGLFIEGESEEIDDWEPVEPEKIENNSPEPENKDPKSFLWEDVPEDDA